MTDTIAFGGGCHWCTEAVFKALKGVVQVEQGYIASTPPNESFSEAVIVHYDPAQIPLEILFEIHLHTHAATSAHSFRDTYRSAIYYFKDADKFAFAKAKQQLQTAFTEPIITVALPFVTFKASRESIQDYYAKNPNAPFCERYIAPKLDFLRKKYDTLLNDGKQPST